jgi:hypothetical protein
MPSPARNPSSAGRPRCGSPRQLRPRRAHRHRKPRSPGPRSARRPRQVPAPTQVTTSDSASPTARIDERPHPSKTTARASSARSGHRCECWHEPWRIDPPAVELTARGAADRGAALLTSRHREVVMAHAALRYTQRDRVRARRRRRDSRPLSQATGRMPTSPATGLRDYVTLPARYKRAAAGASPTRCTRTAAPEPDRRAPRTPAESASLNAPGHDVRGPPQAGVRWAWAETLTWRTKPEERLVADQSGAAPGCCNIPAVSSSCHDSTIWPCGIRWMSIHAKATRLLVAGMPIISPSVVPLMTP